MPYIGDATSLRSHRLPSEKSIARNGIYLLSQNCRSGCSTIIKDIISVLALGCCPETGVEMLLLKHQSYGSKDCKKIKLLLTGSFLSAS